MPQSIDAYYKLIYHSNANASVASRNPAYLDDLSILHESPAPH